ncbi:hypothetical protein PUNSTDRAFT_59307 [Punctularia strigosozonata HHB-11173 SS5]|uniref:uncharacterized protein n=1 Tax=Punctularia strigosozonata (strain HHB-11173) TaxID=741275 RepID=UPI00044167E7|nr:uncharacterized protein PUNSTDRAFT_59307 [Punctularia strigosozonata HHB-11173 SS5]EIN13510.1 hypothetical protein PUNSTDRAFT_59307 [Punctularia strigosozonata HHB-11173 SS5]
MLREPSLKHFILRQRALHLYRHAIRASRYVPDPQARKESVRWIRDEFERTRHLEDVKMIEDRLAVCRREIRQIFPTPNL